MVKDEEGVIISDSGSGSEAGKAGGKKAEVVLGDFFRWDSEETGGEGYDLFYDYT